MKWSKRLVAQLLIVPATLVLAIAQSPEKTPPLQPAFEILNFKIGTDYYPMLDKGTGMTADNPDFPRTEGERSRRSRAIRIEETRSRGKLRSSITVINQAHWVSVTLKNTSDKAIRAIDWDFAFPRYVDQTLVLRYDVATKVEIKPGAKRALKQKLPAGAARCKAIVVNTEADGQGKAFEAVCGPGFQDPTKLKNQETFIIKRIEYSDGTIWKKDEEQQEEKNKDEGGKKDEG